MASIITHSIAAGLFGKSIHWHQNRRLFILTLLCASLPDADVFGHWLGVPYLSSWGHRGGTHSLAFAFGLGLVLGPWASPSDSSWIKKSLNGFYLGLMTASHPFLDMLTTGGHGVALWAPFDESRVFFDHHYRVIQVSPLSISRFFTSRGLAVLKSELYWVILPCLGCFTLRWIIQKSTSSSSSHQ